MCGIAGFILPDARSRDQSQARMSRDGMEQAARAMMASIAHRGPDSAGHWIDAAAGVGLGHRRLAILDLSPAGHQPMASADGRFVTTYNGEIYNFRELRLLLEKRGYGFTGGSDTEILLAAVAEWGVPGACRRFAGMFAFALWDRAERVLHLARDRLGKKPLLCGRSGAALLFGSELAALQAFPGFAAEIDRDVLADYLRFTYVPGDRSIYRGVFKVPPGFVLSLPADRCGGIAGIEDAAPFLRRYWDFRDAALGGLCAPEPGEAEGLDALRTVLGRAVEQRMIADVPLGAFLSGGIDSSLVVALMQERSARPVRTFTIGFDDPAFDEAPHAAAVARHLGTEHTEHIVSSAEARAVVPELGGIYDEPFADPSQIPTLLISRMTRRHVTVALTGDGGDEVFGGYRRYLTTEAAWRKVARLPPGLRRAAAGLAGGAPVGILERLTPALARRDRDGRGLRERLTKLAGTLAASDRIAFYREKVSAWQRPEEVVLGASGARGLDPDAGVLGDIAYVDAMMWIDTLGYLPNDILVKVDRASMSVGLETRSPLLDHRVLELAWQLPASMKIRDGRGKWALRRLLQDYVPDDLFDRPKQGFTPPIAAWLRGPLRSWADDLLDARRVRSDGYFDAEMVRALWTEHAAGTRSWANRLWPLLMFNAWLQGRNRRRDEPVRQPAAADPTHAHAAPR